MSESDLRLITKWCNAQVDEFGEEYRIARELVISKVHAGYEIVNMMCKGENFCEGREDDMTFLTECIMQILHLNQYIEMQKVLFLEYHDHPDIATKNAQLSEQMYLEYAKRVKHLNEIYDSGVLEDCLCVLLHHATHGDYSKHRRILDLCNARVGDELLAAKFIKSLRKGETME